jgi:hypothetical protein
MMVYHLKVIYFYENILEKIIHEIILNELLGVQINFEIIVVTEIILFEFTVYITTQIDTIIMQYDMLHYILIQFETQILHYEIAQCIII